MTARRWSASDQVRYATVQGRPRTVARARTAHLRQDRGRAARAAPGAAGAGRLAEELRRAHGALGEITGEFTSDDLPGEIFSRLCIGK
jgi:tRNA modification GTPase